MKPEDPAAAPSVATVEITAFTGPSRFNAPGAVSDPQVVSSVSVFTVVRSPSRRPTNERPDRSTTSARGISSPVACDRHLHAPGIDPHHLAADTHAALAAE